jgi:prevent-host-death family protein
MIESIAQTLPLSDARENLRAIIDNVIETGTQYTVTRHGRNVAVLLSYEDYEALIETMNILSDDDAMAAIAEAEAELGGA